MPAAARGEILRGGGLLGGGLRGWETVVTERKPPGMSPEDWVRYQIRTAQQRGAFDDLPLTGKPLPASALKLDRDWVSELIQREQLDTSVLLPLSITLAREVEQLPDRLAAERSERRVREIVVDLDERIRAAYRQVLTGPPMRTLPLDVEAVVDRWRASRPVPPPAPAQPEPEPGSGERPRGGHGRRWFDRVTRAVSRSRPPQSS